MDDTKTSLRDRVKQINWHAIYLISILLVTAALALAALLNFRESSVNDLNLQVGNVAPQDILAPYALTYESNVLTAQEREAAAQSVVPVYTAPDGQIARQQANELNTALAEISAIRANEETSPQEKFEQMEQLKDGALSATTAAAILSLSEEDWLAVRNEAASVLEQIQKNTIRLEQLETTIQRVPAFVSITYSTEEANVVADLVKIFVAPNSFYSEELTETKRQQASDSVEPVIRSFVSGETIVSRGRVLRESDIEALQQFDLLEEQTQESSSMTALLMVILAAALTVIYLYREQKILQSTRQVWFIAILFLLFLYLARIFVLGHVVLPFIYPVAAFGLLISALFDPTSGILLVIPLSLLLTFGMSNALELNMYYILSTFFSVLMLGRSKRIITLFWAGVGAGSVGAAIIATNRLGAPQTDLTGILTLSAAAMLFGLFSSGLSLLLQVLGARYLDKVTNLQLMELSRPDHPALRYMLLNAPGTYQHSLQVANLAEQAAEQIGADALLTRVGALYHDIGKTTNPQYFIENQVPGTPNLHDALTPFESSEMIIRHVTDGLELARKHRLPRPITAFISEHHGTTITRYQYIRAIREADGDKSLVIQEDFQYPGPRPQSRETALVMLADGCEARVRAQRPPTESELRDVIKDTIDTRIEEHELDDADLNARDFNIIIGVFTSTLKGLYHPRIEYPKADNRTKPVSSRQQMAASDTQVKASNPESLPESSEEKHD